MEKILQKVDTYTRNLLKNRLPKDLSYHTVDHTLEVVSSVSEIGSHSGLSSDQMEIVLIAAWFHDTGYTLGMEDHEVKSVEIFTEFAQKEGLPEEKVITIIGCIMATKMPQSPRTLLEQVVCDADLLHLGKDGYFEKADLLWQEINTCFGKKLTNTDWMNMNKDFIEGHQYFTEYAKQKYRPKKMNNLRSVINKLKMLGR